MKGPEVPTDDEFYQAGVRFVSTMPERTQVLEWLRDEWAAYADQKWEEHRAVHDARMRASGIDDDGWWYLQVFQYVRRAQLIGINTPQGRQLIGKCIATLVDCLASVIRVHGDLPEPGHPSGEVRLWDEWSGFDSTPVE